MATEFLDGADVLGDCLSSFETSDVDSLLPSHYREEQKAKSIPSAPIQLAPQQEESFLPDPPSPRSSDPSTHYDLPNPKDRPADFDRLQWSEQSFEQLLRPSYWRTICPHLHINSENMRALCNKKIEVSSERLAQLKDDLMVEGAFSMHRSELPWAVSLSAIGAGVAKLMQYGWPPPFIMVFDEPWVLAAQMADLVKRTTGNELIMDFFSWFVDPAVGGRGWVPHRDRAESDSSKAFRADGSSTYTTVWIPMTDASPENSCLYFVPAYADPGYKDSPADGKELMDNVFAHDYANYQDIRAVPLSAGSIMSFTGRLLHWGSRGKRHGRPSNPPVIPRISIGIASSCDEFEKSYFSRDHLPLPPLALRVALMCSQAIVYNRQERLPKERMALYQRLFMAHHHEFDKTYIEKIEFLCQWFRFASVVERAPVQLRKQK